MKVMVAVLVATLTSELPVVTATVGVAVSTVKLVEPPEPALPLFSCQVLAVDADRAGDAVERAVAREGGGVERRR